uniref:3-oxoacyl-[acyl-carrier-protein] synthase II n=1 Tax=Candidatus Kentrum sp. FM TaxID=2126340 RepID=A0A450VQJ0_9GAMM|nr:MAG: 3-oxoacyl-[acyl-carrier-protein] synthase II [Candidatus Kentron sp. FM]VFJ46016.1 MAG: 3-oxoacyl-[acyl-carrier-protein] synthase II [Candidatus Kentron sp. FM]VFK07038.1 MAG: 3-oxoacyl-[acyl-carrier-protein] synthase II [Candidatus Kentron sp. FM]
MHRVMVTGLGVITPIGDSVPGFFSSLLSGKSGVVDFRDHPEMGDYRLRADQVPLAGLIPDGTVEQRFSAELRQRYDPQTLSVLAAAGEAIANAEIEPAERNLALFIGSAVGLRPAIPRMRKAFPAYAQFSSELIPEPRYYKSFLDEFSTSTVIRAIADMYAPRSMAYPFSSLCASGGNAIILGYELIRTGIADSALAIGFDFFHPRQNQVFSHFRLLDKKPIRPFDVARTGYQLGEGIGAVLLESADFANVEKKRPYTEIIGVGATNDGYHMVSPDPSGKPQLQAMKTAMTEARLEPENLDAIATIGRGSKISDQSEGRAIVRLLGNAGSGIPMNSLTPNIGYTLGASSILNFISLVVEMNRGTLFPTLNVTRVDPRLGKFDLVTNEPRPARICKALALGSAFLGSNTAIVLRLPETDRDYV